MKEIKLLLLFFLSVCLFSCQKDQVNTEAAISYDFTKSIASITQLNSYIDEGVYPLNQLSKLAIEDLKQHILFKDERVISWSTRYTSEELDAIQIEKLESLLLGSSTLIYRERDNFNSRKCYVQLRKNALPKICSFGGGVDECCMFAAHYKCAAWFCPDWF